MAANYFIAKVTATMHLLVQIPLGTSKDRLRGFKDALFEKGIEKCEVQMVPIHTRQAARLSGRY